MPGEVREQLLTEHEQKYRRQDPAGSGNDGRERIAAEKSRQDRDQHDQHNDDNEGNDRGCRQNVGKQVEEIEHREGDNAADRRDRLIAAERRQEGAERKQRRAEQ